jgi:hypothetical protein
LYADWTPDGDDVGWWSNGFESVRARLDGLELTENDIVPWGLIAKLATENPAARKGLLEALRAHGVEV